MKNRPLAEIVGGDPGLRAVNAYVRDGFLAETVLERAGRRETDDRKPAIVAGIKGAVPDTTLQVICDWLERCANARHVGEQAGNRHL